jgi:hypothetical protein
MTRALYAAVTLLLASGTVGATAPVGRALGESTLTVTVNGIGHVTSSPSGIDCGPNSTCSASFLTGAEVTLTASVEEGSGFRFAGWAGACGGGGTVCELTVDEDFEVEAFFNLEQPPPPPPPDPPPPPPPPGEPPPPPGGGSLLKQVDRIVARLPQANIAFNAPETLRLGHSIQIQLLLSTRKTIGQLRGKITELGEREGARIKVSPIMEAHLAGLGFRIEPIRPELQVVTGRRTTEWRWEVEATKTGTRRLHLTLSAFIDVGGGSRPLLIRSFDETIPIHVTWYDRAQGFISDNWQWLWAVILAPLAGLLFRNRKRWQQRSDAPSRR